MKKIFAVFDTNVLVSAMLNQNSNPGYLVSAVTEGKIIPVLNDEIIAEYDDVLYRKKFSFPEANINKLLDGFNKNGVFYDAAEINEDMPDPKDIIFFAVTMEVRKYEEAYLITGNNKHFPVKPFVVTPREMLEILHNLEIEQAKNEADS